MLDLFEGVRDNGVTAAVDVLRCEGGEARGAIFTRREVVEFMLDLAGYSPSLPLWKLRFLEPSAGIGAFAVPAATRLLDSYCRTVANGANPLDDLRDAFRAVEIHADSARMLRRRLLPVIQEKGLGIFSEPLLEAWVIEDDFLLADFSGRFDFVVGNPPYVRQELIPDVLLAEYKIRYRTIYDRADLYVPFIERSLNLLAADGRLAFICSDRWMKNRYGRPLRGMIAKGFSLEYHVDMVGTGAFEGEVSAYPSITVIAHEKLPVTRLAHRPPIEPDALQRLGRALKSGESSDHPIHTIDDLAATDAPWILDQFDELRIVRDLEARFPALEDTGCKVGIGVATGADKVFIGRYDELPVEPDRKEPLVLARDTRSGAVEWSGHGVLNPFADDGGLVDLRNYPRLREFLESNKESICRRNVARRNPAGWFRTIDRIYPELTRRPKLLIPDIKGEPNIILEEGKYYPHHNLYYVTSGIWPLRALQIVLRSTIARLFVELYSVRMRGGYLRFQAQYLRRIRLPPWDSLDGELRERMAGIGSACLSPEEVDSISCGVYGVDEDLVAPLRKSRGRGVANP